MPIREPWLTDLSKVTEAQWRRIISNIYTTGRDENEFRMRRQNNLTATMAEYNRRYNQRYNINQILATIVNSAQTGQNVSTLPLTNPLRYIYDIDAALHQERAEEIRNRLEQWHQTYLSCQAGQSQVQPPEPIPRDMLPGGAGFPQGFAPGQASVPGSAMPGAMPGAAAPGGAMPGGAIAGGAMPGAMPGGAPAGALPGGAMPGAMPGGAMSSVGRRTAGAGSPRRAR